MFKYDRPLQTQVAFEVECIEFEGIKQEFINYNVIGEQAH